MPQVTGAGGAFKSVQSQNDQEALFGITTCGTFVPKPLLDPNMLPQDVNFQPLDPNFQSKSMIA